MAYDEFLAERVRTFFGAKHVLFEEKKMMGGLCFMVNDKMCAGVMKDGLMARIDPEGRAEALTKLGCREMDFTGRTMKGFVIITPEGIDNDTDLWYWMEACLAFNPKAMSSKKKSR